MEGNGVSSSEIETGPALNLLIFYKTGNEDLFLSAIDRESRCLLIALKEKDAPT